MFLTSQNLMKHIGPSFKSAYGVFKSLFWCFSEEQVNEDPALAHEFPQDEITSLNKQEQQGKKQTLCYHGLKNSTK